MSLKRKHKTLSLSEKCIILSRLDKGETSSNLAREFNVGKSTMTDLKKNKVKILSYASASESGTDKRQTMRKSDYPLLDDALYEWFLQERSRHTPLSGPILKEKARFFQTKIYPDVKDFKASDGWLDKFKKRHGIRYLTITGEKLSCDNAAVEPFKQKFLETVETEGLVPEQIYNADESGLFWRLLPGKTFVHRNEAQAPGRKISKERITFMPCANATGNHKLKMFVIGKSKKPRAFKNCQLPVHYKGQPRAWMNVMLFKEWFHDEFVPAVRKHLGSKNLQPKAILLLDNCPGHPDENDLVSDDEKIKAMFLPPNCTPLLQPMDQNVIQNIKINYRSTLLSHVVAQQGEIVKTLKMLNLRDVVFFLAAAWQAVQPKIIRSSWNPLLGKENMHEEPTDSNDDISHHILTMVNTIDPSAALNDSDVHEWIHNRDEHEFMFRTDEQIIRSASEVLTDDEEDDTHIEAPMTVKHEEAVSHFNHCLKWAAENDIPWQQILLLQQLREEAVKKLLQKSEQKKITDFFKKA